MEEYADVQSLLKSLDCADIEDRFKHATLQDLHSLSHKEWTELVPEACVRLKLELIFPNAGVSSADTASICSSEGESSFNRTQSSINEDSILFRTPPPKKNKNSFRYFKEEMSLQRLLQKHHLTEKFLIHHTKNQSSELTNEQRHILVGVITDGLLLRHDRVGQEMINDVAHEICELFHNEVPTTYFQYGRRRCETVSIHGNTSKNPKGKLFDKIQNELFRRRKLFKDLEGIESPKTESTLEIPPNLIEEKGWLRYNDSPLDTVQDKWRLTRDLRMFDAAKDSPLDDLISEWPLLKDSNLGPVLVSIIFIFTVLNALF